MENIQDPIGKEKVAHFLPSLSIKGRQWHILFVGDNGQIISLRRFKAVAITSFVLLLIAVSAAIWLSLLCISGRQENKRLQILLDGSNRQVKSFRDEKDMLMARLVLAESGYMGNDIDEKQKEKKEKTSASREAVIASSESIPEAGKHEKDILSAHAHVEQEAMPAQPEQQKSVDIDNFVLAHETGSSASTAKFKIKNTGRQSQKVSGRIFLILKYEDIDNEGCLTVPSADFISGKPGPISKGKFFSVANFKYLKLKFDNKIDSSRFKKAIFYVFSETEELLLEKTFSIEAG